MLEQEGATSREGRAAVTREQVADYLAGDPIAARELFERHREVLLRRTRGHCSMRALRHETSPDDVVDEVFLRALSSGFLERFEDRGRGSLRRALFTILDRTLADACRRHGSLKRQANAGALSLDGEEAGGLIPDLASRLASEDPTPTSAARAAELIEFCERLLDPREWEFWRLSEVEGLDGPDIARRCGVSDSAVRGVLFRARAKLVRALREELEERDRG